MKKSEAKKEKLNTKQQNFCREYIIDFNGKQAAIRAQYAESCAEVTASRLLRQDKVQSYIAELLKERKERLEVDADFVVKELMTIAEANITDVVEVKGFNQVKVKPTAQMSEAEAKSISKIAKSKQGISIQQHDRLKALELLGRHLGMWNDRVTLDGEMVVNFKPAEQADESKH